ncbi:MAG: NapC/NirT family cytochrome c [Actinobacteria bacterium]|nr:NapC/NirT family cytochrome c [Actinomycetota bacterium]
MELLRTLAVHIYLSVPMRAESLFERLLHDALRWRDYIPIIIKFAEQLQVIFQNPRRYPREAVVIIAAILLTLIVVMLLVLLFFAARNQIRIRRAYRSIRKKVPREVLVKRYIIGGAAVIILLLAMTVGTAQPKSCIRCHTLEKSYSSWTKSVHKDTGCLKCHYKPGIFGYVEGNINGAENVLAHFFKGVETPRARVSNNACLRCHNDILSRMVIGDREIKMQHKDLIGGGINCTNCHPDIAHKPKGKKIFAMNSCLGCHDNKVASADCRTCHTQDIGYKAVRAVDDLPKVKTIRITCTGCHKVSTTEGCIKCHGVELPHSAIFQQKHAMQAETTQGILCYKCHWERMDGKRMCGCHNATGEIHGETEAWYYAHRALAKNNGAGCNCHGLTFCARCHDDPKSVYPNYAGGSGEMMHGGWHIGM